jgi:hypothetical protein
MAPWTCPTCGTKSETEGGSLSCAALIFALFLIFIGDIWLQNFIDNHEIVGLFMDLTRDWW